MRLAPYHRDQLLQCIQRAVGDDCEVWLFGSRVDDQARGGDVDLLIRAQHPVQRKVWVEAELAVKAERLLGGRHVDVILMDPATPISPFHQEALRTGVAL